MFIDPVPYSRPEPEQLREILTEEQFRVTQNAGTEFPFTSHYNAVFSDGIYVDVVTGEPLFSSAEKFPCDCGWPAFSAPISPEVLVENQDRSCGMVRTEVRSRCGNSHLGHVFFGEPGVPNGVRYCINGAALRFIPKAELEAQGYGFLTSLFS